MAVAGGERSCRQTQSCTSLGGVRHTKRRAGQLAQVVVPAHQPLLSGATPLGCWQPPPGGRGSGQLITLSGRVLVPLNPRPGQLIWRQSEPGNPAAGRLRGTDAARRARARAASAQANAALAHVLQHPSEVQDWLEKVRLPNLVQLKNWVSAFPPASAAQLAAPPQQAPNGQGPPNNGQGPPNGGQGPPNGGQGPPGQAQSFAQQQPAQAQPDAQPQAQAEQVCAQPCTSTVQRACTVLSFYSSPDLVGRGWAVCMVQLVLHGVAAARPGRRLRAAQKRIPMHRHTGCQSFW